VIICVSSQIFLREIKESVNTSVEKKFEHRMTDAEVDEWMRLLQQGKNCVK